MPKKNRNIVLINPPLPYKSDPLAPLGLETLQGSLIQEGYQNTHIIDAAIDNTPDVDAIINKIQQLFGRLDFVGIGVLPAVAEFTKSLIAQLQHEYKEKSLEICVGGYFPTAFNKKTAEYFAPHFPDYVVFGRGEQALLDILEFGKAHTIPNVLSYLDGEMTGGTRAPVDLFSRPWPVRLMDSIQTQKKDTAKVSRLIGCPGKCTFCTVHDYAYDNKNEKVIQRSPVDFIDEIEFLYQEHGITGFDILDDDALGDNPDEWNEIMDEMDKKGLKGKIKFWILTRIEGVANNPDLIKRMAEYGLTGCYLGVESLLERQLKSYNKMNSRISKVDYPDFLKQVAASMKILEENGIIPKYGFIPIDAETTLEELQANIDLLKEMGLLYYVSELTKRVAIYEGSTIQKQYKRKEYLHEIDNRRDEDWIIQRYNYKNLDPRIEKLQPFLDMWMKGTYQTSIDVKSLNRKRYNEPDSQQSKAAWQLYKDLRDIELQMTEELIQLIKGNADEALITTRLAYYVEKYNSGF